MAHLLHEFENLSSNLEPIERSGSLSRPHNLSTQETVVSLCSTLDSHRSQKQLVLNSARELASTYKIEREQENTQ